MGFCTRDARWALQKERRMKIKALALTMVLLMLLSTVGCDGAFLEVLKPHGIVEICRTGIVALERKQNLLDK